MQINSPVNAGFLVLLLLLSLLVFVKTADLGDVSVTVSRFFFEHFQIVRMQGVSQVHFSDSAPIHLL